MPLTVVEPDRREPAPPFSATTVTGEPFSLADLVAGGAGALVLSRGFV